MSWFSSKPAAPARPAMEMEEAICQPVCPYCTAVLSKLYVVTKGFFWRDRVYLCPFCHKVLGVAATQPS